MSTSCLRNTTPPPPVNRRTETLKTLPLHHTSYVRNENREDIHLIVGSGDDDDDSDSSDDDDDDKDDDEDEEYLKWLIPVLSSLGSVILVLMVVFAYLRYHEKKTAERIIALKQGIVYSIISQIFY